MKKFEITKEQILEVASWGNRQDLVKLREWFPQAFQSDLEAGKWYKGYVDFKSLIYITGLEDKKSYTTIKYYGFTFGDYSESGTIANYEHEKSLVPATDKEVETALIAEAKRRGFKDGVKFNAIKEDETGRNIGCVLDKIEYLSVNTLRVLTPKETWDSNHSNPAIFKNGKWAEIISEQIEVTLEEIAEKFNVNVEQLKIKK